jgi:hypothetical protein
MRVSAVLFLKTNISDPLADLCKAKSFSAGRGSANAEVADLSGEAQISPLKMAVDLRVSPVANRSEIEF